MTGRRGHTPGGSAGATGRVAACGTMQMMRRSALKLACLAGLWSAAAAASPVEVDVNGVVLDPDSGSPIVRLVEKAKARRELPIWIGPSEGQATVLEIRGVRPRRRRTHALRNHLV